MIGRRSLLAGSGAALLSWPRRAHGQSATGIRHIGYLGISSPALEPTYVEAFRQQMRALGYVEGRDIVIDFRWAHGNDGRLPDLAAELVRLKPVAIVTTGTPGTMAAMKATRTIPIVMASSADPVRSGIVASLARPGGNVTGFTILGPELEGKRMQLLKRAVPRLARVAVLWNPSNPGIRYYFEAIETAARAMSVSVGPVTEVRRDDELEAAFAAIAKARPDALAVLADRALLANRRRIVDFAAARRMPAMFPYGEYVDAGGLMSYAPSNVELFRGAASYVDRIIRGAQPATMPVQEPTKFELVVNVKTAKALGLAVPEALLLEADRLVE